LDHQRLAGEIMSANVAHPSVNVESTRLKILLHALLFVAGFSLVFIVGWGGSVTLAGQFFGAYKRVIAQIGGVIVIMFGLATLEVIRLEHCVRAPLLLPLPLPGGRIHRSVFANRAAGIAYQGQASLCSV
jgi:cytochrome c biogenesis protein CcdA